MNLKIIPRENDFSFAVAGVLLQGLVFCSNIMQSQVCFGEGLSRLGLSW